MKKRISFALLTAFLTSTLVNAETISPGGRFEFHIDPWVSLHHFAFHYVREQERDLKLRGRVPLTDIDRQALTADFRSACASLTSAYRPYIEGSLLFDPKTRGLAKMLVVGPNSLNDEKVLSALTKCMPAYKRSLWRLHRSAGDEFLERIVVQLKAHEEEMAIQFAKALDASWPEQPIRVDITPYANWAGAYTDDSPAHITISSYDEEVSKRFAFEILFHESGHTTSFGQSLLGAANDALEATGLDSDRYWHYVLFFVAGRTTFDVLSDPDYIPFAKAVGLTESDSASTYYSALNETWDFGGTLRERVLNAAQKVAEDE